VDNLPTRPSGALEGGDLSPSVRGELEALREPDYYERAVTALKECERAECCKIIDDKHLALGHYARRAKDKRAYIVALRIRARAIRRCGEILRSLGYLYPGRPRKRKVPLTKSTKQAGLDAGLSIHQIRTATRVAAIDDEEFEQLVESPEPPSITKFETYGIRRWYQRKRRMTNAEIERLEEIGYWEGHVVTEVESNELAALLLKDIESWIKVAKGHDAARVRVALGHRLELRQAIWELSCWLGEVGDLGPLNPKKS
jgi:hypothetical protein